MKIQFENKVMTSLLLFIDHEIVQEGEAYSDTGSAFYKIDSLFNDSSESFALTKSFFSNELVPAE